ncbi:MAG: glycosyltransferase [Ignavibacteriales bacterium]|nr:MAG: glycosyltransferase [Ignavibacteriales bacterium]
MTKTDISIIIPIYNKIELTVQCIESAIKVLPEKLSCEFIVIDNGSSDATEQVLNELVKQNNLVKYHRSEDNLGFTKACNAGATFAKGEVLVFLNNDTISLPGWIEAGYNRLISDESTGIVGAKLLYPDDTIQHAGIVFEKRENQYLPLWPSHIYRNERSDYQSANELAEYEAVTGACLFIRKELFHKVGGFEESYGMYFEDIDLCFKVSELGKKIIYDPQCSLIHLEGKSSLDQQEVDERTIAASKIFYNRWRNKINSKCEKDVSNTVYWLAPIFNPSGYASEAITFSLALEPHLDLIISHQNKFLSNEFIDNLPEKTRHTLLKLHVVPPEDCVNKIDFLNKPIIVQHQPGSAFYKIPEAYYSIGRTMFETDRIPQDWVQKINQLDEVWVPSKFNKETFIRSGVKENKVVVIPGGIDTSVFDPDMVEPMELPYKAAYNFLSMFEWTNRKGWDILLRAYFETFTNKDDVCLYLRTYLLSHYDGDTKTELMQKINKLIQRYGYKKESLPRFELLTTQLPFNEMLRLYKSVDAFVLPTRGEGWGRPYMEAMVFGLPVIGTNWSANTEFMNHENSYLIDVHNLVDIKENEIASYLGHKWAEPSKNHLCKLMKFVFENPDEAKDRGKFAQQEIREKYSLEAIAKIITERLKIIERDYTKLKSVNHDSKIIWEGDQFVCSSLAYVNREICSELLSLGYEAKVIFPQQNYEDELVRSNPELVNSFNRNIKAADIHITHQWPPKLEAPKSGRWVVIQPWEFGSLPKQWVEVFNNYADEMWVYSDYIKNVYIESGVDEKRIFVVPLGFSSEKFNPKIKPYKLKTKKKFKFLFLGGTIYRKGIDILLEVFNSSFNRNDDVCLVIKDIGSKTFYRGQTIKDKLKEYSADKNFPEIEYIDSTLSEKQLSGLYTACDVLVHPYRGEGFGLPVLEAMACGMPVIVTKGGSTDDFCDDENSLRINSTKKYFSENKIDEWETTGRPWLLEPDKNELAEKLKFAVENNSQLKERAKANIEYVNQSWTWQRTIQKVDERIIELSTKPIFRYLPQNAASIITDEGSIVQRLITEAYSLYDANDFIGSLNKLEQIISRINLNSEESLKNKLVEQIFNLAGLANLGLKNFDSAKKYFEKELQLNPASSSACFGLGEIFIIAEQYEASKTMFEWAVANDSTNSKAILKLEEVNQVMGFHPTHNSLLIEIPE